MRRISIVTLLLLSWGCQPATPRSNSPERSEPAPVAHAVAGALTGRVWERADSTGRPGVIQVFLEDGTLLMDSCWETFRLSKWQMDSDSTLSWDEDGARIHASVLRADAGTLVLQLNLVAGSELQTYRQAHVPFVCPDMPR